MALTSTFLHIDDDLSINILHCHSYVFLIYPSEFELEDTTEAFISVLFLDILLNIDVYSKLMTNLHDKGNGCSFFFVNVPYSWSNISLSPAYDVDISHITRYARLHYDYNKISIPDRQRTRNLTLQGFQKSRLRRYATPKKFDMDEKWRIGTTIF